MRVYTLRFNLFLLLAGFLPLLCGCESFGHKKQSVSALAVFVSVAPGATSAGGTETVSVLRSDPVQVNIDKTPVLTEQNVLVAKLVDTPDAPAIDIQFDPMGTVVLEQYSATNPGGHFVILGKWGKDLQNSRWLSAPLITTRIKDGIMSFTPDMSRDEATNFVQGLNNVAKGNQNNPTPGE